MRKAILLNLILIFFVTACKENAKSVNFIGKWDKNTKSSIEDGILMKESGTQIFKKDGTYIEVTTAFMIEEKTGNQLLKASGPEEGKWEIKDNKLVTTMTSFELEEFESNTPLIDKETLISAANEFLNKPLKHTIKSKSNNHIVIIDDEDETTYTLKKR